jgi:hypothetical protein
MQSRVGPACIDWEGYLLPEFGVIYGSISHPYDFSEK